MSSTTDKKSKMVSVGSVAGLLMATALIGQVLGFVRTMLISANFDNPDVPLGQRAGVYFAAFNIPDFFFYTIAAGALGVAVMPYLSDRLHKGDRRGMWELVTSLMNLLALLTLIVGIIIFVFAHPLIDLVAPGLKPQEQQNAATLMRFLALHPFLFTVSGILACAQQTLGRFFFFAIAPLLYNLSIIFSIFIFKDTSIGIVGLGIGALVGAVLQLGIVALGLVGARFHWKPTIKWKSNDFRSMLRQLPPRSLDQGADQVQSMVDTRFASNIGGALGVSNYNYAYVLHTAPILLLGTAISTAAFPRLNARLAQGRHDLFRKEFLRTLRIIVWVTVPVVITAFFGRGYLARLIFKDTAPEVALLLGFLTIAIFFRTVYAIISRWFYAQKDTMTPLIVSVFVILLNIILVYLLTKPSSYGLAGLALAQSLVATIEVAILSVIMVMRDRGLLNAAFWTSIAKIVSVTGFTLVAGYLVVHIYPLGSQDRGPVVFMKLALLSAVIMSIHVAISALFGLEEVRPVFKKLRTLIFKSVRIPYW